jgi:hypothetical protein
MPRKQDPDDVIDDFRSTLNGALQEWRQMRDTLLSESSRLAKRATIDGFTRVSVSFEQFRSDWHIAAINRDSTALQSTLRTELQKILAESNHPAIASWTRVDLPKHPSLHEIRDLLDPTQSNLSISSYKSWTKRAKRELASPYLDRLQQMRNDDRKVMNAVIKIRNVLMHGSSNAGTAMNLALANFDSRDVDLRRGAYDVRPSGLGSYLMADRGGRTRFELYVVRLGGLARRLRVSP